MLFFPENTLYPSMHIKRIHLYMFFLFHFFLLFVIASVPVVGKDFTDAAAFIFILSRHLV